MRNYITIIDLGDDQSNFAQKLGILSIERDKYICASLDLNDELLHRQTFYLAKSIEGIPPNNSALKTDVLSAWKTHQARIKQATERMNQNG